MKYVRVYADSSGESHFADIDIDLDPSRLTSQGTPLQLSSPTAALEYSFIRAPAGWRRDRRPALRRELFCYLAGEVESQVSDGEVRRFGPGCVTLVEDTTGKGHTSHVMGNDEVLLAVVQLLD